MGYSFQLAARAILYAPSHRTAHITALVTSVVEHWLEQEIDQWVHHEGSIQWHIAPREDVLPRSNILIRF